MFDKVDVKGSNAHPLFVLLQSITRKQPDWNFAKYLIARNGRDVVFYGADVEPLLLQPTIEQLLHQ